MQPTLIIFFNATVFGFIIYISYFKEQPKTPEKNVKASAICKEREVELRQNNQTLCIERRDRHCEKRKFCYLNEARQVCKTLGKDLPTKEELALIWCHSQLEVKKINKNFPQTDIGCKASGISSTIPELRRDQYWSYSKENENEGWALDFYNGRQFLFTSGRFVRVRCISRTDKI